MKILLPILLALSHLCHSQVHKLSPLKIGDELPDSLLTGIVNYPTANARLHDFKGKLLILDFWDKGCSACISAFPKMEKLQEQFENEVQFLLVTNNTEAELESLFKRSAIIKGAKLPLVIGDSLLHNLFPHILVPFHVWVNRDGYVIEITDPDNISSETLKAVLSGKDLRMGNAADKIIYGDKSLLIEDGGRQIKQLKFYSFFMNRVENLFNGGSGLMTDSVTHEIVGFKFLNEGLLGLCKLAIGPFDSKATILDVKKPERLIPPNGVDHKVWENENIYCYEVSMPGVPYARMKQVLLQDIERYFGISVKKETRNIDCWVLLRTTTADLLKSKFPANGTMEEITKDSLYIVENGTISSFLSPIIQANEKVGNLPVIDETGYKNKIDITIRANFSDFDVLNKELSKYGLKFIQAKRYVQVMIIKDI